MASLRVRVNVDGGIVIPAEYLDLLDIRAGDTLVLSPEGNALHIHSIDAGIRRAQALVRQHTPTGRMLSDELIAERRAEAARENER